MISTSDNKKIEIRPVWIFDVMVKLEQKIKMTIMVKRFTWWMP